MTGKKVVLKGSERRSLGTHVGDVPQNEIIEASVILKPRAPIPVPLEGGAVVSREEFAGKYGADPKDLAAVREMAKEYSLTVLEESAARLTVRLRGTVADMERAFVTKLDICEHQGQRFRSRTGTLSVPEELSPSIVAVLGLDSRPAAKPQFRIRDGGAFAANAASAVSYNPRQVAQLYQFPLDVDGTGQTIGIIELGGGYKASDLTKYFPSVGLKAPSVTSVSVDKGKNSPTTADSADGEVLLDIEVAGSVAPGAKIVVYFAPNTTQGFQDAISQAIHDTTHKPTVISISWGGPESSWTVQAMTAFDTAAQSAAALGVTVCAASGDNGSGDGVTDGKNHVDFPASSPHILACGGTSVQSANGAITGESIWNDGASGGAGGGGFSAQFPLPSWQVSAKITPAAGLGRGVPDVAGDADPQTGYNVLVDGQSLVFGGTSAVAPLWSGLIALLNEKRGKPLGFLQPSLYALPKTAKAFRDITAGSNGAYSAAPGWDPCSGLGSPSGQNLVTGLAKPTAT